VTAVRTALLAVLAAIVLAGCGGSAPRDAAATTPAVPSSAVASSPPPTAPGAAFCARLKASPKTVQVVYASEVERQVGLASGNGSVTPETIQAARTLVALWITISCPKFAYLEQRG
jgi:ABC-type glycerol-3-phosphate transport system substrate-binding protein